MFKEFDTTLKHPRGVGTWSYFIVPLNILEEYGDTSRIKAKGTINGAPFNNTLLRSNDGTNYIIINKEVRDNMDYIENDNVHVEMELSSDINELIIPEDFLYALNNNIVAKNSFEHFPHSYKKELIDWIINTKSKETRAGRIRKTIKNIVEGKPIMS